uniref:ninjurin-2-like isoform X1 n=1 Tax=Myxine glutinosa TaxID=7769 RepID=UPI00358E0FCC
MSGSVDTMPLSAPSTNGSTERPPEHMEVHVSEPRRHRVNLNHYATKKSVAESMLDVALLMANASQLKAVIEQPNNPYYTALITFISISIFFQVVVGVLLVFIVKGQRSLTEVKSDVTNPDKQYQVDTLNNIATGLVFVIVVVNIFITAFGVHRTSPEALRDSAVSDMLSPPKS